MKQRLTLLMALCAARGALAQATHVYMPEDTYDVSIGAALLLSRHTTLLPTLAVQWSNGVFVDVSGADGMQLGLHLSERPNEEYGPLLSLRAADQRTDTPGGRRGLTSEVGAFYHWTMTQNLGLFARAMAGGGSDRRGVYAVVGGDSAFHLSTHQGLQLNGGLVWANQTYVQSYFGVTAEQAQAGGNPPFRAKSGLLSVFVAGEWEWQIGNKYQLNSGVRISRLAGSAADSPLGDQARHATAYSALTYHF
jgi:outer membrane protein